MTAVLWCRLFVADGIEIVKSPPACCGVMCAARVIFLVFVRRPTDKIDDLAAALRSDSTPPRLDESTQWISQMIPLLKRKGVFCVFCASMGPLLSRRCQGGAPIQIANTVEYVGRSSGRYIYLDVRLYCGTSAYEVLPRPLSTSLPTTSASADLPRESHWTTVGRTY